MKKFISSILAISFCLTVTLSGCGGSGGGNNVTGGGNGTVTGNLAYVNSSDGITAYSIDDATGALKPISGVEYDGSNMVVNPDGKYIYCEYNFKLRTYVINSQTGTLTTLGGDSVWPKYKSAAIHPKGKAVYVLSENPDKVTAYSINNNGTIGSTMGSVIALPGSNYRVSDKIAVDHDGNFACISSCEKDTGEVKITVCSIDSTNALTVKRTISIKSDKEQAVSCSNVALADKFAFVNLWCVDDKWNHYNKLYTYNLDTGQLVSSSDAVDGEMVFSPNRKFVYFVSNSFSKITLANFDAAKGLMTATNISVNEGQERPNSMTFDPTGKFAYVAYEAGKKVVCYTVNSDTGVLKNVSNIIVDSGPKSIVTIKR